MKNNGCSLPVKPKHSAKERAMHPKMVIVMFCFVCVGVVC